MMLSVSIKRFGLAGLLALGIAAGTLHATVPRPVYADLTTGGCNGPGASLCDQGGGGGVGAGPGPIPQRPPRDPVHPSPRTCLPACAVW
jgi:hypothetical protein